MPNRDHKPDEIDESSPNRQIICNNGLGPILIGYREEVYGRLTMFLASREATSFFHIVVSTFIC